MSNNNKIKVEGLIIENVYRVDSYIGGGSFGSLYTGTNLKTKQLLAIKLEPKDTEEPQLPLEFRFYSLLGKNKGIPEVYYFGPCSLYNAIVMEMLGPTLHKMHIFCKTKFSADTTGKIAQQIISIMEFIHNKKIIFRDIKPENFLLGINTSQKANTIHIIDFGLAKEYIDKNGKHIPMKDEKSLIGTPRYMSIWSHSGKEQSRRDDMESIGYMLIYLVKGSLPWQGFKGVTRHQRYKLIAKSKRETTIETLCKQIPKPFAEYMKNVRNLKFETKPNYKLLFDYFKPLIDNNLKYDWEDKREGETYSNTSIQTVTQNTVS